MATAQRYKNGDAVEEKVIASGQEAFDTVSLQKDEFYEGAYECHILGEAIWDSNASPLSNAISREVFREAFKEIFDAFVAGGTFEAYLTVFHKIFGDDADITFVVPAAGKLNITIDADEVELSEFIARYIEDNAYIYDEVIDEDGDNIVLQTIKGFASEYELEQMLHEMVPAGIFTNITLNLGV